MCFPLSHTLWSIPGLFVCWPVQCSSVVCLEKKKLPWNDHINWSERPLPTAVRESDKHMSGPAGSFLKSWTFTKQSSLFQICFFFYQGKCSLGCCSFHDHSASSSEFIDWFHMIVALEKPQNGFAFRSLCMSFRRLGPRCITGINAAGAKSLPAVDLSANILLRWRSL